ncbi:MAG: hypothetical protein IT220_04620 [Flavobacteriaceae bacterium]|nr:hypothetical protein [Flavobacteriaceae bacterium]
MYKNVVQSLEKQGKSYVEKQIKNHIAKVLPKAGNFSESTQQISEVFKPTNTHKPTQNNNAVSQGGVDIWTWVYVGINAFMLYLGYRNDEVIGVMLFSIVILLFVFLRISKPKPYNWLVKILLILQGLLLLAFALEKIERPNIMVLLMLFMFAINLRLIFKGNKS